MTQLPNHYYLLRLCFLGFRFQGWQRQPGTKSVEGMVLKTLNFVLPGRSVKLLGAGRTDARVSAIDFGAQLVLKGRPLTDLDAFQKDINKNLPADIELVSVIPVSKDFNAIRDSTSKTYRYYFSFGTKPHPFCAPFLGYFPGFLDIERMKKAASAFVGTHNYQGFIVQPGPAAQLIRKITRCELSLNNELTASFFPEQTYYLDVAGPGFGRNQVRLMVAALVALGRGELLEESLKMALLTGTSTGVKQIAPSSGLHLLEVQMEIPSH
ncbi:tRNA pseudouridine synthase A [Robiginitalea sp.]|uniref:tRNA pseudouridine synthase A n=1 Tax=Robiginitalea sp. TaxID=1902411 RepID=UPI003C743F8C